jgi:hypothetical protein
MICVEHLLKRCVGKYNLKHVVRYKNSKTFNKNLTDK